MSFLFALLACLLAALALLMVSSMANGINLLTARVSRLERKRGLAVANRWVAMVKPKEGRGKPVPMELTANDDGDALRQLLNRKIDPIRIVSLNPATISEE